MVINRSFAALLATLLALPACAVPAGKGTVPLSTEDHRLFVIAEFTRKDGSLRPARLWVDTGTPDFQISESLAKDLGLDISGSPIKSEDGIPQVPIQLFGVKIGGVALDLRGATPMVVLGSHNVFAGRQTEGNLPATVLMHYRVVLDVPHETMTLLQPTSARVKGQRVMCLVQRKTGMVQVPATVDGKQYSLALDSGAPYSMISTQAIKEWATRHKNWPQVVGAAGPASLLPARLLRAPMMRVPEINWGGLQLKHVAVLGMDPDFVAWYSKKTSAPVIGFLSWNVLRAFRVTIDYPNSTLYFERKGKIDAHDMDVVGLALAQSRSGGWPIVAIVQKNGQSTVEGVQPGDKLLKIDGADVSQLDLERLIEALGGRLGVSHTIEVERKGTILTLMAKVTRLI